MNEISDRLRIVQECIANAAARANRDPNEITLVAVSKMQSVEAILAAYAAGVRHFGENRVEEAAEKIPIAKSQISKTTTDKLTWHLIGHLQSRKVKDAAPLFDFVHSIDSVSLAQKLDARAAILGKKIPILLEVNVSGEESKYGFAPSTLFAAVEQIIQLENLDAQGLMTIAPIVENAEQARPHFGALRKLRDQLRQRFPARAWQHLSMGMTDDFEAAIAEGATIIRIGRAIFGERK